MTKLRLKLSLALLACCLSFALHAEQELGITIESANGRLDIDPTSGVYTITNGVIVTYGSVVLTADSASVNKTTGETSADGRVRIQMEDQLWAGEHIRYNFKTRQMSSDEYRTGKFPV